MSQLFLAISAADSATGQEQLKIGHELQNTGSVWMI